MLDWAAATPELLFHRDAAACDLWAARYPALSQLACPELGERGRLEKLSDGVQRTRYSGNDSRARFDTSAVCVAVLGVLTRRFMLRTWLVISRAGSDFPTGQSHGHL
jgi:hypothetical protein